MTVPEPAQEPEASWKQPADNAMPLLKVLVAPEERLIEPPVIVRPEEELRPAPDTPPANVEVAVEEALSPPFNIVRPEMFTPDANVEEAAEVKPPEELIEKIVEVELPADCF